MTRSTQDERSPLVEFPFRTRRGLVTSDGRRPSSLPRGNGAQFQSHDILIIGRKLTPIVFIIYASISKEQF